MVNVATPEVRAIAQDVQRALSERDVQGLAVVAVSVASGVVIAQELADRILPALGYSANPTSATGFMVSGVVKFAAALVLGVVAAQFSGLALILSAFIGVGHLASAGADFFNALQRTGFLAEGQASRPRPTQTTSASIEPSRSRAPLEALAGTESRNRARA